MAYAGPELSARATPLIRNYDRTSSQLGDIRVRLTTGNRVVRIGDDTASLTTANLLQAQGSTLRSGLVNSAKTSSLLSVTAQGLRQIKSVLETLSTLTETANAAGRTNLQLKTLDAQFQSGLSDIDTIVATTTYDGTVLLDGSASGLPAVPLGNLSGDSITVDIPDVTSGTLFPVATSLATSAAAATATTNVSDATQSVEDAIAVVDAYLLRLTTSSVTLNDTLSGLNLGLDALIGTNDNEETQNETFLTLRQNTAAALLAQTNSLKSGLLALLSFG